MSPILGARGGLAASAYGLFTLQATNSYESIATVTVGSGGQSTISFTSIPSTYKHLQIRCISRESLGTTIGGMYIQLNSDTGSNYAWHRLFGDGSTVSAGATASTNAQLGGIISTTSGTANVFSAAIIDILDYANTSKNKTMRSLTGLDYNGSGYMGLHSGLWMNTAAVTTITLNPDTSQNWQQYSSFALYGIKG
jgi:hypothetical protein